VLLGLLLSERAVDRRRLNPDYRLKNAIVDGVSDGVDPDATAANPGVLTARVDLNWTYSG
jgi:hypothetical protein